jgi:hypothetical protein
MAARTRKAAKTATFHAQSCQILLVSFKILTQSPSSQPMSPGAITRAMARGRKIKQELFPADFSTFLRYFGGYH